MSRPRPVVVVTLGAVLALALALGSSGDAAASVGAPSWSTGDFWTWTWSSLGVSYTRTWTVAERLGIPVGTKTYDAWHVNETVTRSTSSGSSTSWNDLWVQDAGLAMVKEAVGGGTQTFTWDPPRVGAVFPLDGNTWNLATTETRVLPGITVSQFITYSGAALPEVDVSVPQGTFHATPVRSPSSGSTYDVSYYSDSVGNWVQIQSFVSGSPTTTEVLTAYRYQSPGVTLFLVLVGGFVALGGVAAATLYVLRRRQHRVPRRRRPPRTPPPSETPSPPPRGPPRT